MSLSIRSQLAGTSPYFAWAIEYILDVATQYGGSFQITSVNRSKQQQWELYRGPNPTAVFPGCSQHQYGAAADVLFPNSAWQEWYLASARNFGLTTVRGDSVHVQLVPGARFREWSQRQGLCPDTFYRRLEASLPRNSDFPHNDGFAITRPDGSRTWVWNTTL